MHIAMVSLLGKVNGIQVEDLDRPDEFSPATWPDGYAARDLPDYDLEPVTLRDGQVPDSARYAPEAAPYTQRSPSSVGFDHWPAEETCVSLSGACAPSSGSYCSGSC